MIQKLRKKIQIVITSILWIVLLGVLLVLNISNYNTKERHWNKVLDHMNRPGQFPKKDLSQLPFTDAGFLEQQFKHTLIVSVLLGVVGMIVLFAVAYYLSVWLVAPVKESFEKQKQFISDASHELKTPMAVIEANVEMTKKHPEQKKYYEYIHNEIWKMNRLIQEMLTMARFDSEIEHLEKKKFDVSRLAEGSCLPFESIAFEQGHPLSIQIEPQVQMYGNEQEISQVIGILLDNALKYSRPEGNITFSLKGEKGKTVIQVKNEGTPIPKEDREAIFERFYRSDKSRERSRGSFGLGLSIAKKIVENHKGCIYVKSGEDSNTFYISI